MAKAGNSSSKRGGVSRGGSQSAGVVSARAKVVWGVLLATMTGVGGLLYVLDTSKAPIGAALNLPPMLASTRSGPIDQIFATREELDRGRWDSIVIYHSASPFGTPESLRTADGSSTRFHFVIGNGRGMDDGTIHPSDLWLDQEPGTHATGKNAARYNEHAISICLIGNGDRSKFTDAQIRCAAQLAIRLARELKIPSDRIVLHRDIAKTSDPGKLFAEAMFREQIDSGL